MSSKRVLAIGAVVMFVQGVVAGWYTTESFEFQKNIVLVNTLVTSFLLFWWFRVDAAEVSYKASPFLGIGVMALAVVFVPVYLWRSRAPNYRRVPLMWATVGLVGLLVVRGIGGFVGGLFRGLGEL